MNNTPSLQDHTSLDLGCFQIDSSTIDVFLRLKKIFQGPENAYLTTTDLHDLTCFVLHELLRWTPQFQDADASETSSSHSECFKCTIALYLLILHGPTYFSHAMLQHNLVAQLRVHIENALKNLPCHHAPITLWIISVGLVASKGMPDAVWYGGKAADAADALALYTWDDVVACLENILWYKTPRTDELFKRAWEEIWTTAVELAT